MSLRSRVRQLELYRAYDEGKRSEAPADVEPEEVKVLEQRVERLETLVSQLIRQVYQGAFSSPYSKVEEPPSPATGGTGTDGSGGSYV